MRNVHTTFHLSSSNTLRIAIENESYIGFVTVGENTTLAQVRASATEELGDSMPKEWIFVLEDGAPVNKRQEHKITAASVLPCALIRIVDSATVKVQVESRVFGRITGPFVTWITASTTFRDLKISAAGFWGQPPRNVLLQDADGCSWPDGALVERIISQPQHKHSKIVLVARFGDAKRRSNESSEDRIRGADAKEGGARSVDSVTRSVVSSAENELWRIFTWYCVSGDPYDVAHLQKRHFVRMLRDCGIVRPGFLSQAEANVIYMSECRRRKKRNKLSFRDFVNALFTVARRTMRKKDDDSAFGELLELHILKKAQRWQVAKWRLALSHLRSPEVVCVFSRFDTSLRDFFCFYASVSTVECESCEMPYKSFLNFCHDFGLADMHAGTRKEFVDAFLASCASRDVYGGVSAADALEDRAEQIDSDGVWHPRVTLSFDRFEEAIGRFALATFSDIYPQKSPGALIKAMLQHMGRSLKRSKVMRILSNRRDVSTYPAILMQGTKTFHAELLKLWREDDARDYLTGSTAEMLRGRRHSRFKSSSSRRLDDILSYSGSFRTQNVSEAFESGSEPCSKNTSKDRMSSDRNLSPITVSPAKDEGDQEYAFSTPLVPATKSSTPAATMSMSSSRREHRRRKDESVLRKGRSLKVTTKKARSSVAAAAASSSSTTAMAISPSSKLGDTSSRFTDEESAQHPYRAIPSTVSKRESKSSALLRASKSSPVDSFADPKRSPKVRKNLTTTSSASQRKRHDPRTGGMDDASEATTMTKTHELEADAKQLFSGERNHGMSLDASLKLLQIGAEFIKHGRRGSPHLRYLFLEQRGHSTMDDRNWFIRWCEVENRESAMLSSSSKRCIPLNDIVEVREGQKTVNFKSKSNDDVTYAQRCFSLVTKRRTVDLAAESLETRDAWVAALRVILDYRVSKASQPVTFG
eukprot:g111.t1